MQAHVEHVRVADEHVGRLGLDGLALGRRRVAVIDGGGQKRVGQGGVQFLEGLELVLLQGLQREQIQGVALGSRPGAPPGPADYKSGSCRWPWAWPPAGFSPPGCAPGPPPDGSRAGESPSAPTPPPPAATVPIARGILHRLLRQITIMAENIPVLGRVFQGLMKSFSI